MDGFLLLDGFGFVCLALYIALFMYENPEYRSSGNYMSVLMCFCFAAFAFAAATGYVKR